jgi:hypothetical protein
MLHFHPIYQVNQGEIRTHINSLEKRVLLLPSNTIIIIDINVHYTDDIGLSAFITPLITEPPLLNHIIDLLQLNIHSNDFYVVHLLDRF